MRSVLAQLEFAHNIKSWDEQGVPFRTHLYVPEVHPLTGVEFCEREDEGHVFKVSLLVRCITPTYTPPVCSVLDSVYD